MTSARAVKIFGVGSASSASISVLATTTITAFFCGR
jgi:hypothetical protein